MRVWPAIAFAAAAMVAMPAAGQGTDDGAPVDLRDPGFAGRVFDSPIPSRKGDPSLAEDLDDPRPAESDDPATAVTEDLRPVDNEDPAQAEDGRPTIETRPLPVVLRPGAAPDTDLNAGGRIKSVPAPDMPEGEGGDSRFIRAPDRTYGDGPDGVLGSPIASPDTALRQGARLRQLDKMTGQIVTFDIAVGETRDVARLKVKLDACRAPDDNDTHGTMAFLHIWDTKHVADTPAFTGWMFAESPALSALDHPRYDLWVINCRTVSGETSAASE
jgi:hypothetical protein